MKSAYRRIAVRVVLIAFVMSVAFGQGKPAPKTVSAVELQSGSQIIGLLGFPLGEVVSIKGRIVESNTKGGGQLVEVVEVDGNAPTRMLQMRYAVWEWGNISRAPLPADQMLRLRVYETGGMVGIPIEAMRETTFVQTEGWGFGTSLVLLNRE
jgi:hypothetical protein